MPLCTECQYNWSWKESMSLSFNWSGSQEISCPACREGQYVSERYKRKLSMVLPFLIIIILLANLVFGPSYFLLFSCLHSYLSIYWAILGLLN